MKPKVVIQSPKVEKEPDDDIEIIFCDLAIRRGLSFPKKKRKKERFDRH